MVFFAISGVFKSLNVSYQSFAGSLNSIFTHHALPADFRFARGG